MKNAKASIITLITLCTLHYIALPGPMRGGYIGPGPESQEGACESLKGPVALAINVLFRFFFKYFFFFIFNNF